MCGAGILLGAVPFAMVFNVSPNAVGLGSLMGIALLGGFLAACAGANIKAILMNVNPARDRGSVFGFLSITDAIGPGLGPLVGTLFFGWFGFNGGMNFSILWWIPCALAFFAAAASIEGDRRRARLGGASAEDASVSPGAWVGWAISANSSKSHRIRKSPASCRSSKSKTSRQKSTSEDCVPEWSSLLDPVGRRQIERPRERQSDPLPPDGPASLSTAGAPASESFASGLSRGAIFGSAPGGTVGKRSGEPRTFSGT